MDGMNYSTVPVALQFKFVLLSDTLIAFLTIFSSVYLIIFIFFYQNMR